MTRVLLVMVLTLLAAAPAAMAGTRSQILRDCESDGKLDGNYTASQIRDARNNIPADIDQYSNCRDVLARALGGSGKKAVGGGGGGGGGGSGGGGGAPSQPLTPSGAGEQRALDSAGRGGSGPVQLGEGSVVPGAAGFATGAARNPMPVSVLAVLILLGLTALAGAVPSVRRRVLARWRA
jgi:hypothetical protein